MAGCRGKENTVDRFPQFQRAGQRTLRVGWPPLCFGAQASRFRRAEQLGPHAPGDEIRIRMQALAWRIAGPVAGRVHEVDRQPAAYHRQVLKGLHSNRLLHLDRL